MRERRLRSYALGGDDDGGGGGGGGGEGNNNPMGGLADCAVLPRGAASMSPEEALDFAIGMIREDVPE